MKKNWIPRTKWTKGGTKLQQSKFGGWIPIERSALAVFITPSLKEVLRIFGKNILILKARGEKQIESSKTELSSLGIKTSNNQSNLFIMNYDTSFTKVNKHDTLNKNNIKKIINHLEYHNIKDCAVEFLMIKITDKELKNIIQDYYKVKIGDDVFYATFELNMCEADKDREKWDSTPYNSEVLRDLRFKHSILHCVKLIDDGQVWNIKRNQRRYFIDWKPKKYVDKISPEEISHGLMKNLGDYGYVKKYALGKNEELILKSIS